MKKTISIILFIISVYSLPVFSQGPPLKDKNLEMYWYYRHRLKNMFMKIGPNSGESLPAASRSWQAFGNNFVINDDQLPNALMKWGDTTFDLGHYLGVLATEYRLLTDNGQLAAAEKTKTELFYALGALSRLDFLGDCTDPYYFPCSNNGYFIRDDVYKVLDSDETGNPTLSNLILPPGYSPTGGFVWQNSRDLVGQPLLENHFNQAKKLELFDMPPVYKVGSSDYSDTNGRNKEMSQDQVYHLLLGLTLVHVLMDSGTLSLQDLAGNPITNDFRAQAMTLTMDIAQHCSQDWTAIKTPVQSAVLRGWDMTFFAHGYSKVLEKKFGAFSYNADNLSIFWNSINPNSGLGTGIPSQILSINVDNRHMAATLGALSNGWGNDTESTIIILGGSDGWNPFYIALNQLLYSGGNSSSIWFLNSDTAYENLFDSAPCHGPKLLVHNQDTELHFSFKCWELDLYSQGAYEIEQIKNHLYQPGIELTAQQEQEILTKAYELCDQVNTSVFDEINTQIHVTIPNPLYHVYPYEHHPGWHSTSKFIKTWEKQLNGDPLNEGYFNGLDYMLVHNLYYLTSNHALPNYEDIEDRHYSNSLYSFINSDPSTLDERNIIGISTLTADNKIFPSSSIPATAGNPKQIHYKANDWITLEPGFEVTPELNDDIFTANIVSQFECDDYGYHRIAQSDDGTKELIQKGYYKNHKYIIPDKKEATTTVDIKEPELSEEKISTRSDFSVAPNPSQGTFTFSANNLDPNSEHQLIITDVLGQIIISKNYASSTMISDNSFLESNLAKGTYFLILKTDESILFTEKVIIQ